MTIDKSQTIKIPVWLVSVALPLIVAAIGVYGMTTAFRAETKTEIRQLQESQNQKIDRKEFELIIKSLDKMDAKLDKHLEQHNSK